MQLIGLYVTNEELQFSPSSSGPRYTGSGVGQRSCLRSPPLAAVEEERSSSSSPYASRNVREAMMF